MMSRCIEVPGEAVFEGNLILINEKCGIKGDRYNGLVGIGNEVFLNCEAAGALEKAVKAVGGGEMIVPVSGFRSAEEQKAIFQNSMRENGEDFTRQFVALPGHSEHQTGLAIDLGLKSENIDFIRPNFPYEGICQRFRETAPRYGFIERYPKGKEKITGIAHEPWHFRYVGLPHAEIMTDEGLTLEEYMDFIKGFTFDKPLGKNGAEIYYEEIRESKCSVRVPDKGKISISGNNLDGVIVTVFK